MPLVSLDRDRATRSHSRRPGLTLVCLLALLTVVAGACSQGSNDPESGGATRTVESTTGPVEIPAEPQRMIVDWVTFDNLLALEVDLDRVAGVFSLEFFLTEPQLSPFMTEAAVGSNLETVGEAYEPNYEKLAAARPDVIILAEDQAGDDAVIARLRELAPVVVYDLPEGEKSFAQWKSGLRGAAGVLGGDAPPAADRIIAEFETKVAAFKSEHADLVAGTTVSVGNIVEDGLRLSMPGRNLGTEVAVALGLKRPDAQNALEVDSFNTVALSPEQLPVLDADVMFLEQRQESVAFLETNPFWQRMGAVQQGRVHFVGNYWEFGGAGSAARVLDEMIAAVTENS